MLIKLMQITQYYSHTPGNWGEERAFPGVCVQQGCHSHGVNTPHPLVLLILDAGESCGRPLLTTTMVIQVHEMSIHNKAVTLPVL